MKKFVYIFATSDEIASFIASFHKDKKTYVVRYSIEEDLGLIAKEILEKLDKTGQLKDSKIIIAFDTQNPDVDTNLLVEIFEDPKRFPMKPDMGYIGFRPSFKDLHIGETLGMAPLGDVHVHNFY